MSVAIPGGSAYAMTRDIAEGYLLVTERSFKRMAGPEMDQLAFELDRHLRELRGEAAPTDDQAATQARNRRIQRLNAALMLLRAWRQKSRA